MTTIAERKRRGQRGLALVEMTIVLLLLVLLTFGVMEYGWMFFRMQQVTNSTRLGVRNAILPDSTNAEVLQIIQTRMTSWGIGPSYYTVAISAADITVLDPGDLLTVSVDMAYGSGLLGMSLFPLPGNLVATVTMAKEGP